jgi:hypothetical protein
MWDRPHTFGERGLNKASLHEAGLKDKAAMDAEAARIAKAVAESGPDTYCTQCERHRCRCGKEGK